MKDLDRDEWGRGYKIAVRRTNLKSGNKMSDERQLKEAKRLFPCVEDNTGNSARTVYEVRAFTTEELQAALGRIKNGRAPGPNGILPDIARAAVQCQQELFLSIVNTSLLKAEFPEPLKVAKLVLIEKIGRGGAKNRTYRPISLLNVFEKLMEAMLEQRLREEIERKGGLHDRQYGFRRVRSTIGAMKEVQGIVREVSAKAAQHKGFCVLVTLDVRNAFNAARWSHILNELERRHVERYLIEMTRSYLSNRVLLVGEREGMRLTCGVPQGSVLGPLLWNMFYDGVLRIGMPEGVTLIGYADDLALVAVAKTVNILRHNVNTAVVRVIDHLKKIDLQIAPEKTEVVVLAGRRKLLEIDVQVEEEVVKSKKWVKYLGVVFDKNTKMVEHIKQVAARASAVASKLIRLMPNVGGPRSSKRRVIGGVINSIILYGAPIWCSAMKIQKYRNMLLQLQRKMALWITSAYRTVSTEAAQVMACTIPIDLLVKERERTYGTPERRKEARKESMSAWQQRWENLTGKAAWTRLLIPEVEPWTTRKHGETNYYLSQMLSGHGCFRRYLNRINKEDRQSGM